MGLYIDGYSQPSPLFVSLNIDLQVYRGRTDRLILHANPQQFAKSNDLLHHNLRTKPKGQASFIPARKGTL